LLQAKIGNQRNISKIVHLSSR